MMKKIISIIAALAIAMSFTTAFAANADKIQEVLVSVKSRIDVPDELSEFESNTNHSDYTTQYQFEWHTEDYEKSMYVSCYDDGVITSYASYDGYREREPHMSKMSADEAKAIAEDFVKKINPSYPYEVTVNDSSNMSLYSTRAYFHVEIRVNGILLRNGDGNIAVDTETGSVTDFNIWYEPDAKEYFTGTEQFISEDAAQAAYTENFPMELVYRSNYDDDNKEIFYPVYVTTDNYNEYINAITGEKEAIDFYRNTFRAGAAGGMDDAEMATADSKRANLTPQELEEIENINGLISREDVEKQLRSNKTLGVPVDVKLNYINLYKNPFDDTYYYNISMSKNEADNYAAVYATVNAKTGEIINYNRISHTGKPERDATFKHDDTLKALAGNKANEYKFDEDTNQYIRYVNGIKVEGNNAYITYEDSILTYYSISYSDADFPSLDGAISAEDAAQKMFEQTDYNAVCVAGYNSDGEACLYPVYSLDRVSINPFTGKAVNWRNEEITGSEDARIEYSDIDGHYAEKYITTLAEYGIGFEGGLFNPDEKITQSDLLTLLTSITSGNSVIIMFDNKEQSDFAYSRSLSQNIIRGDECDDNAIVTRETASIYLIRAIGAEEYAKYNDIYVTPFTDVTENKGYIALLSAMGVVNGDGDNKFNPKREITRAEFAVMLYNYLNR